MKPVDLKRCFVALAMLAAMAPDARAQEWLHLDPIEGEMHFEFDGRRNQSGNGARSDTIEYEEGIRLRQSGHSLDPRIATFMLEIEPVFSQVDTSGPGDPEDQDSDFLNYNGRLSFLHGTAAPLSLGAQFSRDTGNTDGTLGSRTDFESERRSLQLNWKNRAFPTTLSYTERQLDQEFQSAFSTTVSERDELLRTVQLRARSSKMDFSAEGSTFDDRTASDRDYESERVRLGNYFRWGSGSRLTSRLSYLNRDGFNGYERFSVDESASLHHTDTLSTSYGYRFQSLSQQTDTTVHAGNFGLTHRLYQNLTTDLNLSATFQDLEISQEDGYEANLDFSYNKEIVPGVRLTAGLGGGYGLRDRQSEGGLASVPDEQHSIPSSGIVLLNNRFIVASTIVVIVVTGPAICSSFDVIAAANNLTQLEFVIPDCEGATIEVGYDYEVLPSAKYYGLPYRARAELDFGWIRLFHRTSGEEQELISGIDESVLSDSRQSSTGFELRWRDAATRATFGAERRVNVSGDFESEEYRLEQDLFHTLSRNTSLNFTAHEDFVESNGSETQTYGADLSMRWRPRFNLNVQPHLGGFYREADDGSVDEFITGGVDVEWTMRSLRMNVRYNHDHRGGTGIDTDEDRLFVNLTKRF